jgi:autotransporter strand-loop-strand O-heptosyltransferase
MITYNIHHVDGLFFEILNDGGLDREYDVCFLEKNEIIYQTKLKPSSWARLDKKYFSDIFVLVTFEGNFVKKISIKDEIQGKRVLINFESSSLGDTIAWMPYCEEFRNFYKCDVIVSCFHNNLFRNKYPHINFTEKGELIENIHAGFELGWFYDDKKEPVNPSTIPLQKNATNILNIPFKEIKPYVDFEVMERPIKEKYIAISTFSTSQCKLWYYWQELIDSLNERGYKVIEVSMEKNEFKNIVNIEDKSIQNVSNIIHHSEFFIGLSSGLSWLSWALNKKVVMISNFSVNTHEFQSDCTRISDTSICNGCWNNELFKFNKGDWNWCPEHEDTPRQFECHKKISLDRVLTDIEHLLNNS